MSKQTKLLNSMYTGKEYTAKQITGSFGIAHPASAIRNLREQGHCVYSNKSTLSDGTVTTKYRIGRPTKAMIAVANRVLGAQAFGG